ncbi:enolase C-terminal domain-like protein [Pseudonocardia humida]|uniref:glucarate dehydratase n=1 Tax=Pseudonocardia humida TaxID=2800819 RepID=A0ABT0ZSV5_9PSEU|nr:enolase C-terminal domain-like protein [Pseudonocardia humida]MCO1653788.1 glucarate dehydratase [Pseudonocardia humida]
MNARRISRVEVVPVAFADPPLLNAVGVHEPFALRAVVRVRTDDGLEGLGETYADEVHLRRLAAVAAALPGSDPFATTALRRVVADVLARGGGAGGDGVAGMITGASTVDRVLAPFEVACLDLQGRALGLPVVDLLGGRVRDAVPYSAYLFYKWAGHPGADADGWGEALTPDQLVAQARRMVEGWGFTAIKLKGGVLPPDEEVEAVRALAAAFPGTPLRLDPNAAWTVETGIRVAKALDGLVEYLEDPVPGIDGMAAVAAAAPMPLATNMAVVAFDQLPPAVAAGAVQVVLGDHHFWGGLRRSQLLAGTCDTFGLGLSMHSNSHLGISLAAMTHLGAATPNLTHACDTHWPWKTEDVVRPGALRFVDGAVAVPAGPGLGVELDEDALGALHERYLACGLRSRDDTGYMRRFDPAFERKLATW